MGSSDTDMNRRRPITLALAATFTAQPIEPALAFWVDELSLAARVAFAPYGQVFQALLDSSSVLSTNGDGANVLLIRVEDWDSASRDDLHSKMLELAEAIEAAARRVAAPFLVVICPQSQRLHADPERSMWCREASAWLTDALGDVPGVDVVDSSEASTLCAGRAVDDPQGDETAQVPYTPVFFTALATVIARWLCGLTLARSKAIIVDCDDTLWAGVCGEEGPHGVAMDDAAAAIQHYLVRCYDRGVLVALCSRNNEADVRAVFDYRSDDMPLQWHHVVAARFNWNAKSRNIRALAADLQLPLDAFVFLDNDPVECAEVQANCPEVLTILLPEDRAALPRFLDNLWLFDRRAATDEARARTALYRQNLDRARMREEAPSLADFVARLDLRVQIADLTPARVARASELTQRTNQFNLTTVRRSEADIGAVRQQGADCMTVQVRDRFGDYGVVGLMIFMTAPDALVVDSFLLSCRALGRGVEHRMLKRLGEIALDRNLRRIDLPFVSSGRNQPALGFLQSLSLGIEEASATGSIFRVPAELAAQVHYEPREHPHAAQSVVSSPPGGHSPSAEQNVAASGPDAGAYARANAAMLTAIAVDLADFDHVHAEVCARTRPRPHSGVEYVHPRTPAEQTIATILAHVLGIDSVGVDDNFFQLGGHSLLALQVLFRIREAFQVELSPRVLYNSAFTAADLARRVLALQVEGAAPLPADTLAERLNELSDDDVRLLLEEEEHTREAASE